MKYVIKVKKEDIESTQEELFKLGYKWYCGATLMKFDIGVYFYLEGKQLQWGGEFFKADGHQEITLKELKELEEKSKTMNHKEAIENRRVVIYDPKGKNHAAIVTFLTGIGLQTDVIPYGNYSYSDIDKYDYFVFTERKVIARGTKDNGNIKQYTEKLTFEDFLSKQTFKNSVEVKLNSEYKALVTKETITVGCQTFDVGILDQLVAAHKEVTKC